MEGNRWKLKIRCIVNEHITTNFKIFKSQNFLNFADQIGSNEWIILTMSQVKYIGYTVKQYPFPVHGKFHRAQWWVLDFVTMTWSLLRINIVKFWLVSSLMMGNSFDFLDPRALFYFKMLIYMFLHMICKHCIFQMAIKI